MLPLPLLSIYECQSDTHEYNTRQSTGPRHMKAHTDLMHRSFLCKGPILWSKLDGNIKSSKTKTNFKIRATRRIMEDYWCFHTLMKTEDIVRDCAAVPPLNEWPIFIILYLFLCWVPLPSPEGYRLCLEWHPRKYIFCIDYIIPYCIQNIYIYTFWIKYLLTTYNDPGQWFGKIQVPVTRVQHLVRTNSYVNATVSLVRRYGAVACMKQRELIQNPDCILALQHDPDLLTWASYLGVVIILLFQCWSRSDGDVYSVRYPAATSHKREDPWRVRMCREVKGWADEHGTN